MITTTDCWGPYRSAVEERLTACEDLLGRLRRSFDGGVSADRLYFADKAHGLRDAAQSLVDRVDDIEWWLGACPAPMAAGAECGRAAGHSGDHQPDGECREQQLLAVARRRATAHRDAADRMAWSLLAVRAGPVTAPPSTTVAAALVYAAAGWPVLPVAAYGKHPLVPHGVHDASVDPARIRRWWRRWPDAGVGIATGGRSGLAIIDVDVKAGGRVSLVGLRAGRGGLPFTILAHTGGGGVHLYYRQPAGVRVPNTVGRLPNVDGPLPGIDLRGDGGYVVAPPSGHASGRPYRWATRQPAALAPLPRWLWPPPPPAAPRGRPCTPRPGGASPYGMAALLAETQAVRALVQGQRNDGLNRAAFALGTLVAGGELAEDLIHRELLAAALAVGLGEQEASRTIASGLRAGARTPRPARAGRTRR